MIASAARFIARVGGDEFILLLLFNSLDDLMQQLAALISKFEAPIILAEHEVVVKATLGVTIAPTEGAAPDLLIRRADMALYDAKRQGGARYAFFDSKMEDRTKERAQLERELRIAVKGDQIIPYFQPVVELASGTIVGFEVLARWPQTSREIAQPGKFIRVAEEIGLIDALTVNLLRRACTETLNWPGAPRMGINIAPSQLRDSALPQKILKVLSECGFPPARLVIEITEEALVSDVNTAKAILTSFKNLGTRIALDDFGIGYSSLQHLLDLPLDFLKIDRSFVSAMCDNDDALVIVKAIIQLAKNLRLDVTAEGIETEAQANALLDLGCKQGQGFFLGRPSAGYSDISSKNGMAWKNGAVHQKRA